MEKRKVAIMEKQEAKQLVLETTKRAYAMGLFAGTSGNLSIYNSAKGEIYITPSSTPYETMQAEDIVTIDLEGHVLEGELLPSSEWRLHTAIYKARPDAGAVVHTHSPYATAYATMNRPIPMILVEMLPFIGDTVKVARFALPGDPAVGTEAVHALEGRKGCLLQNHGVVAIGEDLPSAFTTAVYIEDAAKICYLADTAGVPNPIPEEQIALFRERMKGGQA